MVGLESNELKRKIPASLWGNDKSFLSHSDTILRLLHWARILSLISTLHGLHPVLERRGDVAEHWQRTLFTDQQQPHLWLPPAPRNQWCYDRRNLHIRQTPDFPCSDHFLMTPHLHFQAPRCLQHGLARSSCQAQRPSAEAIASCLPSTVPTKVLLR